MLCECAGKSEQARIICFIDQYNRHLRKRGKPTISKTHHYTSLKNLVIDIRPKTLLESVCENLILKSFYEVAIRSHPFYEELVPDFGNEVSAFKLI
jgi:hypothetical protein